MLIHHQVRRLDVPMHHPLFKSMLESQRGLSNALASMSDAQPAAVLQYLCQTFALNELHYQEVNIANLLRVVSRNNVGV
jgi:hypothetical protein